MKIRRISAGSTNWKNGFSFAESLRPSPAFASAR